ncbi:MAG: mycothiol synthase [Microthrixaceae bacterium]|nr:mycothiol synthase [Microthrixaceae bacterium]
MTKSPPFDRPPQEPDPSAIRALAERFGGEVDHHEGHERAWVMCPPADLDSVLTAAAELDLRHTRTLLQMSVALPVADPAPTRPIATRPFEFERDHEAWLRVNNAAFAWHPDQGNKARADLETTIAEPWFDPEGFRILDLDETMAGFCWTKIHSQESPPLGEIFVIAVAPEFAGRGLGRALTLDGLDWMARQRHLTAAMLYVEADNTAALRTYEQIGFEVVATRVAFEPAASPNLL